MLKKIFYIVIITFSIISCNSDDDSSNNVENFLIGLWEIDKIDGIDFLPKDRDVNFETSFQLEFKKNGEFLLISGEPLIKSTWSLNKDNSILTYNDESYLIRVITNIKMTLIVTSFNTEGEIVPIEYEYKKVK